MFIIYVFKILSKLILANLDTKIGALIYIYMYVCVYIYTYIDVYLHIVHQVGSTCLYSQYQVTMQVCVRAIRAAFDFTFNVPSWNRSYQMG